MFHSFVPEAVLLNLGPLTIYWYGFFAALGLMSAWLLIAYLGKKYKLAIDFFPLFAGAVFWGVVSARLYHVTNEAEFYFNHPFQILQILQGGLALHGGILGALIYVIWWSKRYKLSLPLILDIFATGGILIQIFGRFGNYFNQELFGLPTNLPWGISIDLAHRPLGYSGFNFFHPTFLYEVGLNTIIFIFLIILHRWRLNGRIKMPSGYIFLGYLLLYSLVRFGLEFIRIDQTPVMMGWRLPQIVSLGIIGGVVIYAIFNLKNQQNEVKKF